MKDIRQECMFGWQPGFNLAVQVMASCTKQRLIKMALVMEGGGANNFLGLKERGEGGECDQF